MCRSPEALARRAAASRHRYHCPSRGCLVNRSRDCTRSRVEWNVSFGFISANWEIGTKDEWYVECQVPEAVFDEMVRAYKEGSANGLKIRCKANLWADRFVRWAPIVDNIAWKIPREQYGTASGHGKIESFSWEIVSKGPKEEEPAYKAGQALADDVLREAGQPAAAQPAKRSYGWVWVTAAVVVFWIIEKYR